MGFFDPHVLLSRTLDQVSFCFNALYDSFWVSEASMSDCRASTSNSLITSVTPIQESRTHPAPTIPNLLELLTPMPTLCSRFKLFHFYRSRCFCITESHKELPAVKSQDGDTSSQHCRLSSVKLPAKSYLYNCPDAIAVCTSETALMKYKDLELQFKSARLSGDPWSHVDTFGRSSFLKTLTASFKGDSTASRSSSVSTSAGKKLNWALGKKRLPISVIFPKESSGWLCKNIVKVALKNKCTKSTIVI